MTGFSTISGEGLSFFHSHGSNGAGEHITETSLPSGVILLNGKYRIERMIGRGGFGITYLGKDMETGADVAIKELFLQGCIRSGNDVHITAGLDSSSFNHVKSRFIEEANIISMFHSPSIVAVQDVFEENNTAYYTMEYLSGQTLQEILESKGSLSEDEVKNIGAKLTEALIFIHSEGILHRDIKPANIMRLKETGDVKVTDFGIARITSSSKTKTGVVMGTPSYMSPEQLSGKKVDGRSDIFSLGIVLFELLTGEKPFKAQDMTSLMYKIEPAKTTKITFSSTKA